MAKRHDLTREQILEHALRIQEAYAKQRMTLTLRQLYYRFVAEGICESGQVHYKRIGDTLTDARYNGSFPIEGLEDRGRDIHEGSFKRYETGIEDALDDAAGMFRGLPSFLLRRARWAEQETHVSVWVEKQALEGVFQPVCDELGVSWFAAKGYPSVSALWEWLQQVSRATSHEDDSSRRHFVGTEMEWTENYFGHADRCVVLYFGDHDPDGWEIPRSAERNIRKLMDVKDLDIDIEFRRIALNMDQVDTYNPPPFEAKMSSARYAGYVEEHETENAWELDALEPVVLRDLIREEVSEYFNETLYEANQTVIRELQAEMIERMRSDGWAADALGSADE